MIQLREKYIEVFITALTQKIFKFYFSKQNVQLNENRNQSQTFRSTRAVRKSNGKSLVNI